MQKSRDVVTMSKLDMGTSMTSNLYTPHIGVNLSFAPDNSNMQK